MGQIEEETKRKQKEEELETKTVAKPVNSLVKSIIQKPFEALMKLIAGWAIMNLPRILREVTIFTKKVRVFASAMKKSIQSVGGVFSSLVKITGAFLKNISEFDFTDKSGRIKAAQKNSKLIWMRLVLVLVRCKMFGVEKSKN